MNQKDLARFEKDYIRCLGLVAQKLLENKEEPYILEENEIEHNGTIRKKTLRLLSEAGKIRYYDDRSRFSRRYGWIKYSFSNQFKKDAPGLQQNPNFEDVPREIEAAWENVYGSSVKTTQEGINEIGYREIHTLKPAEKIYVWFHRNEFIKIKKKNFQNNEIIKVFPRELLEHRKVQALRGSVKKYAESWLMPWLIKKTGLDLYGFDTHTTHKDRLFNNTYNEYQPSFNLRNCKRFPKAFTDTAFNGPKGYRQEYYERFELLLRKTQTMRDLVSFIKKYGYNKLMVEFTEYARARLLDEAPLRLVEEENAGAAELILNNFSSITYENMFGY